MCRAIAIVQTSAVVVVAVGFPARIVAARPGLARRRGRSYHLTWHARRLAILRCSLQRCCVDCLLSRSLSPAACCSARCSLGGAARQRLIHQVMPWWVANTAMVAMGAVTGSRFGVLPAALVDELCRLRPRLVCSDSTTVCGAFDQPAIAACRRGHDCLRAWRGADAMMLLALALNLDPVYVGARSSHAHFFRVAHHAVDSATQRACAVKTGNKPAKRPLKPPPYRIISREYAYSAADFAECGRVEPLPNIHQCFSERVRSARNAPDVPIPRGTVG